MHLFTIHISKGPVFGTDFKNYIMAERNTIRLALSTNTVKRALLFELDQFN